MDLEWLKSKRTKKSWSQAALADILGKDERVIHRWENCEEDAADVPYARLAELFEISELPLREDHVRDLEAAGRLDQARKLRSVVAELRAKEAFKDPVDWSRIVDALEACQASEFTAELLRRMAIQDDLVKAAKIIAAWLEAGAWEDFTEVVDTVFESAVVGIRSNQQHDALRQFLITIVTSCAARDKNLKGGNPYTAYGGGKPWAYRAFVDRSLGRESLGMVRPHPDEPQYRLNDDRNANRTVHSGLITQISEDARVHEVVNEFTELLNMSAVTPPIMKTDRFEVHCRQVNAAIATHNSRKTYVIGI